MVFSVNVKAGLRMRESCKVHKIKKRPIRTLSSKMENELKDVDEPFWLWQRFFAFGQADF